MALRIMFSFSRIEGAEIRMDGCKAQKHEKWREKMGMEEMGNGWRGVEVKRWKWREGGEVRTIECLA